MESHPLPRLALILIVWFTLLALIVYLVALQDALKKCAPTSRTMKPGKVWLWLIPVFGLVWQFIVVVNIAKSLRNEFARLGIPCRESTPGQAVGLLFCLCNCCTLIPLIGRLAALVGFVLWIAYWIRIANYSRLLDANQTKTPPSSIA
jgi:hypothetical protein